MRNVSYPSLALFLLTVFCCPNLAARAATPNEKVSQHLDAATYVVSQQEADLKSDIAALNELNRHVGAVLAKLDTGNPESVANALNATTHFQQGIEGTKLAAAALGKSLDLTGNLFDAVKRKEADGTLVPGTLTPIHLGIYKDAQTSLSGAKVFINKLEGEVPKHMEPLARAGVKPLSVNPTRVGLVVVSSFFPEGRTTGPKDGYVWIVNFSKDKSHTYTVTWTFNADSGSVDPAFSEGTLKPGESRRLKFTVNVRAGGEMRYTPDFQWK